jgi:demethylmenaquinone methyltransferase/2-methoxy-6-polyprenyl-1,4-benzoquinol methylase
LKKNGTLVVLEFSKPKLPLIKQLYSLYMNVVTPGMGSLFSKNRNAYQYLNDSVQKFPEGKAFQSVLDKAGFQKTNIKTLSFGICTIYTGEK